MARKRGSTGKTRKPPRGFVTLEALHLLAVGALVGSLGVITALSWRESRPVTCAVVIALSAGFFVFTLVVYVRDARALGRPSPPPGPEDQRKRQDTRGSEPPDDRGPRG